MAQVHIQYHIVPQFQQPTDKKNDYSQVCSQYNNRCQEKKYNNQPHEMTRAIEWTITLREARRVTRPTGMKMKPVK